MVLLILTYDGDREDDNIHSDYYQDKFYLLIYQYFGAIFVAVICNEVLRKFFNSLW